MREIIAEQGLVLITCQFCDEEYRFDENYMEALFSGPQATLALNPGRNEPSSHLINSLAKDRT